MTDVAGLILAAGDSSRMGSPKALLPLGSETFLERIASAHRDLGLPIWVILGSDAEVILSHVKLPDVAVLVNPEPKNGPLSSLLLGLARVRDTCGAVLVHPVDHPLVTGSTLQALLDRCRRSPDSIILPECGGRTGHPVVFPRRFFAALREAPLDAGARRVVLGNPDAVLRVEVDDPGIFRNIDTPEAYSRWVEKRD
jgi:molybdenum cofactor cytidylyltransferase